jgi:hypothetical protein
MSYLSCPSCGSEHLKRNGYIHVGGRGEEDAKALFDKVA